MARCEEGYLCDVCGKDVENIHDSDLYLRFVIGQVDAAALHTTPERHIRCNPALAQFIVAPDFPPVSLAGDFDKRLLDHTFVQQREELVTRGWRRLLDLHQHSAEIPLTDYPLPPPSAHPPTANEPTANETTANEPTANEPTANEPTANEPTANT